jgi:hypothetical protein
MACFANPRTQDDGLVLCFDAGNNKSYSSNRFLSHGTGLTTANVTFPVQGNGTFQRVGAETVIGGYTVKPTDVVYSYVLGSTGCHYHGNNTPIPAGVYATFTFDYLVTGATTYPITNYLANLENKLSASIATANSLQDVWQRRSFTAGPTSSAGTLRMLLYPGACGGNRLADSGTIYYRNPRVEYTNVDTGTDNFSSMSSTTTWTDMVGGNDGTLTNTPYHFIDSDGTNGYMSFDGSDDYIDTGSDIVISPDNQGWTAEYWFNTNSASTLQHFNSAENDEFNANWLAIYNSKLAVWNRSPGYWRYGSTTIQSNTWYQAVFVCDSGGTNYRYYINGVREGGDHVNNVWNSTYSSMEVRYIGRYEFTGSYSRYFNGKIAKVSMYNRALSASEVKRNFMAQRRRFGL